MRLSERQRAGDAGGDQGNSLEKQAVGWSLHQPLYIPGWPSYNLLALFLFPVLVLGISVKDCVCYAVAAGEGGVEKQMANSLLPLPPLLTETTQCSGDHWVLG